MELTRRLFVLLNDRNMSDVPVFLGGIIPNDDIPELQELGITEVFGPGTNSEVIVHRIEEVVLGERSN
jgi:methylmalonyl-CoA mutase C-terminal domain/subunit